LESHRATLADKHRAAHRNLRPPWKPGESGNPNGRPKRRTFSEVAYAFLAEKVDPNDRNSPTRLERLCETLIDRAIQGDMQAAKLILDRVDPIPRSAQLAVTNAISADAHLAILHRLRHGDPILRFKGGGPELSTG